jgi:hypothetical protein
MRCRVAVALALVALTGCGTEDEALPGACNDGALEIEDALSHAPGRVTLRDGVSLSTCIERARSDGDLQEIGSFYVFVADRLAARVPRSDPAALRLGYLIGATRRGASRTNGIHDELVRRVEQTIGIDGAPPARQRAFRRGLAAGARNG